jgi:hypothetical protein
MQSLMQENLFPNNNTNNYNNIGTIAIFLGIKFKNYWKYEKYFFHYA